MWLQNLVSEDDSSSASPAASVDPLFANATIYIFVRLITILYQRLAEVKNLEAVVSKEIGKGIKIQHGLDFGFTDDRLDSFNLIFTAENVYDQLLKYVGKLFEGEFSTDTYEEIVRQSYKNRAVKLYTVENLAKVITVYLDEILQNPKAAGLVLLNDQYREQGTPTAKSIIVYRTKALALNDPVTSLFQINFDNATKEISFELLEDQITYDDEVEAINNWTRYISEFSISDPTPNVPVESVKLPFLNKSLRESNSIGNLTSEEKLGIKVCPKSYRLFFDANTEEFFAKNSSINSGAKGAVKRTWFKQFLDGPKGWRADLNQESQLEAEGKFETWKTNGPDAMNSWQPPVEPTEKDKKSSVTPPAKKSQSPVSTEPANTEEKKLEREVSPKEPSTEAKTDAASKATESNSEPPVEKQDIEMKDIEPDHGKEDVEMKDAEPQVAEPYEKASTQIATDDTTTTTATTTTEKLADPITPVATDAPADPGAPKNEPEKQVPEKPVSEKTAGELTSEEPAAEKPTAEETVSEKPAAKETVSEKPVTEEPVAENPVSEKPVAEKPVSKPSVSEKPASDNATTSDPVTISIELKPEATPTKPEDAKDKPALPANEEKVEPTSSNSSAPTATGSPEPTTTNPDPESIVQNNAPLTQK